MSQVKPVAGALWLFRFFDPMYVITRPIQWSPLPDSTDRLPAVVIAPAGFVTDFASVPRAFWSAFRPDGTYAYAATIHDYLYWTQTTTREVADLIFLRCMEDMSVARATANVLYEGVRLGGASAWAANAELRAGGERRVLVKVPDDPTVTWDDWRKRPDAFAP